MLALVGARRAPGALARIQGVPSPRYAAPLCRNIVQLTERPRDPAFAEVPEGHQNSELSDQTCNVTLTRRKDLTLQTKLRLNVNGEEVGMTDLLGGKRKVIFGVPNRGKVCTEQHVPGFVALAKEFQAHGYELPSICVTVGRADEAREWAAKLGVDGSEVVVAADEKGNLNRFLGLELGNEDDPSKPQSLRWAAISVSGVLYKVLVEEKLADVKVSSAPSVLEVIEKFERKG